MLRKLVFSIYLLSSLQILLAQTGEKYFKVHTKAFEAEGYVEVYANNENYCPFQCELELTNTSGAIDSSDVSFPYYCIIEPQSKNHLLFRVYAKHDSLDQIKFYYRSRFGNPETAQHNDDYEYTLPYKHRKRHFVSQGYFGKYSHQRSYALDFKIKTGKAICATREGIVIQVREDSDKGGADPKYSNDANYIRIYHEDGTWANYLHIMHEGSAVQVGDKVDAGQVIAYAGSTGWSTMAHLHFEVRLPTKMGYKSIPTKFKTRRNKSKPLKAWRFYRSYHRDKDKKRNKN